jgi:hypothetical protein
MSTPTTSSTDDVMCGKIIDWLRELRKTPPFPYAAIGLTADAIMALIRQDREAREAVLKADIAHAIGFCRGLGHPHTYLENRYPDIAAPDSKAKACIICGHTAEDEEGLCGNCKEEAKA